MAVMELVGLRPRVNEIGRIRLGEKAPNGAPKRLTTFRLTSYDKGVLDAAQTIYGGTVQPWKDAPDEGFWQLTTTVAAIDILIPRSLQNVTQSYELWTGGAAVRRCDGRIEELSESPCLCEAKGKTGADRECEVMTRLSVILPRLPGLGVWRLDTGGWHAATTIPSTLELLMALDPRSMVPAVLRAVQRSSKAKENGKTITHRFVVPVLDAPGITIGQLVGNEAAQLTDGERPRPLTAEERVAAKRADAEARQSSGAASTAPAGEERPPLASPVTAAAPVVDDPPPAEAGAAAVLCGTGSPYDGGLTTCVLDAGHERKTCKGADGSTWEAKRP